MLRYDAMMPHKLHPVSRKIDVDISGILLGSQNVRTNRISQETFSEPAFGKENSDDAQEDLVGQFGWISFNFVAVCTLIAFFSIVFIRDSFEYSRRSAHLPADASDLKPEFRLATSPTFDLARSERVPAVELDQTPTSLSEQAPFQFNHGGEFSLPSSLRPEQSVAALSNNNGSVADRISTNTSTATASGSSGPSRASRTPPSTTETAGAGEQSRSTRSTKGRVIRQSLKSPSSTRRAVAAGRHSGQKTIAGHSIRQNLSSIGTRAGHNHTGFAKTNASSVMSMQSLGTGAGMRQIHGATNLMHMEGGLLGQPGLGAGLGGVTGNGLGGGSAAGNRGAGRVAK